MIRLKSWPVKAIKRFGLIFGRVKPRQKPVRTSKNPVRVVFVCPFGGSSNALSKAFSDALRKRGINSVVATFFSSEGTKPSELRVLLKDADFVISRTGMMVSRRQLRASAPSGSKVLRSYPNRQITRPAFGAEVLRHMTFDIESETDRILAAIGRRFRLEN